MPNKLLTVFILFTVFASACSSLVLAQEVSLPKPGLLPDSPFYFLKLVSEKIRLAFASPEDKVQIYVKFAEKRLAEAEALFDKNKEVLAQRAISAYVAISVKLEKLGSDKAAQTIAEAVAKHVEVLKGVVSRAPESAKTGLQQAIEVSQRVITKFTAPTPVAPQAPKQAETKPEKPAPKPLPTSKPQPAPESKPEPTTAQVTVQP